MQMPVNDMMTMAKTFAESGMFQDIKSAAQAFVKIQAGFEIGIQPFQALSGMHVIAGKAVIGAGIMAAKIKASGKYDYKVMQQDDKACSIDFYEGKEKIGNSTFTIEDARKAGTKNIDKFPRNMLFARAISNGQRWYAPDVFITPVYVPEEMNGLTEDAVPTEVTTVAKPQQKSLPNLSEKQYIQALGRIATGDTGIVEKLQQNFTISDDQMRGLEEKLQLSKNEPATATQE